MQAYGNQASSGEHTLYAQSYETETFCKRHLHEVSGRIVFRAVGWCHSHHVAAEVGRAKYGHEPPETMQQGLRTGRSRPAALSTLARPNL